MVYIVRNIHRWRKGHGKIINSSLINSFKCNILKSVVPRGRLCIFATWLRVSPSGLDESLLLIVVVCIWSSPLRPARRCLKAQPSFVNESGAGESKTRHSLIHCPQWVGALVALNYSERAASAGELRICARPCQLEWLIRRTSCHRAPMNYEFRSAGLRNTLLHERASWVISSAEVNRF